MTLNQLTYFCMLAKTQSYTQAAQALFIAQPSLSYAISTLEKELGCLLVAREGRRIFLTPAGETFYRYAKAALEAIAQGVQAVQCGGVIRLRRRHIALPGCKPAHAVCAVPRSHCRFSAQTRGLFRSSREHAEKCSRDGAAGKNAKITKLSGDRPDSFAYASPAASASFIPSSSSVRVRNGFRSSPARRCGAE